MIALPAVEGVLDRLRASRRGSRPAAAPAAGPGSERPHPAAGHDASPSPTACRAPDRVHQAARPACPCTSSGGSACLADRKGPHRPTHRQTEWHLPPGEGRGLGRTGRRAAVDGAVGGLRRPARGGLPEEFRDAWAARWRWTGRTWSLSRPPPRGTSDCADPEASWGHRKNNLLPDEDELFFGYYLSAAIMVPDEQAAAVPELARRVTLSSCRHDPVRAFAARADRAARPPASCSATSWLTPATPTAIPQHWADPLRRRRRSPVQDLHPHDRGPKGTHHGAIIANGNLYCPQPPPARCWDSGRSPAGPPPAQAGRHDATDRRGRPLQARPPHPRRRRRLPPGRSARPPRARSAARCAQHR